jgi:multisubunit Na+/H+ antiporter MnhB subunit
MGGFAKRWFWTVVTSVIAVYVATRVEPFKSHFLMALLMAVGVGIIVGAIEVGIRKSLQR